MKESESTVSMTITGNRDTICSALLDGRIQSWGSGGDGGYLCVGQSQRTSQTRNTNVLRTP